MKSIIERTTDIVAWYNHSEFNPESLSVMFEKQKELASLLFDLAKDTAVAKRDYDNAYGARKIAFSKEVNAFNGPISRAEHQARETIATEIKTEKQAEALFNGYKLILNQGNAVLDSLRQSIAWMRKEKDLQVVDNSNSLLQQISTTLNQMSR